MKKTVCVFRSRRRMDDDLALAYALQQEEFAKAKFPGQQQEGEGKHSLISQLQGCMNKVVKVRILLFPQACDEAMRAVRGRVSSSHGPVGDASR